MNERPENVSGDGGNAVPGWGRFRRPGRHYIRLVLVLVFSICILVIAFNGFYILSTGEEAVILRFGAHHATVTAPGLQFKLPFVDEHRTVNVQTIHHLEFGYRSDSGAASNSTYTEVDREAVMLTGDENLVVADWAILYRVRDPFLYLYRIEDPEETLRILSESSYRRVVASHPLDDILTDKKDAIQSEILVDLQELCDEYESGVQVLNVQLQDAMPPDPVKPAFLDVSSAREERTTKENEAEQYRNEQIPVARGEAERTINEAEAYRTRRINEAEGDAARYQAIQAEYVKQPGVTRTRLYLEMIREVLPKLKSITIADGDDVFEFLPIGGDSVEVAP